LEITHGKSVDFKGLLYLAERMTRLIHLDFYQTKSAKKEQEQHFKAKFPHLGIIPYEFWDTENLEIMKNAV